jgi:hypothetical protein
MHTLVGPVGGRRKPMTLVALCLVLMVTACSSAEDATPSTVGSEPSSKSSSNPIDTQPVAGTAAPASESESTGSGEFVEAFTGNTGLDRFETGMFHRDEVLVAQTEWSGDHDMNCGSPDTQRLIHRDAPSESFFMCKDHLMTSVGDTSGYSIAWFKPRQTFNGATMVSWDVNVTFLGSRQWWEVMIVPADAPDLACSIDLTACGLEELGYPAGAIVVNTDSIYADGVNHDPWPEWHNYCFGDFIIDPEGCDSKALRRTFTVTDNLDGTITVAMPGIGEAFTYPGSFPTGDWKVVFKDHNYTPDKDGIPVGHTWHWDSIIVR